MQNTIYETFELPSKGLIYDTPFDPHITLRSMTTAEEMKRLSPTTTPYKVMADIIEDCMSESSRPPIHVYDMCLGDYQFLLHKLRIVTYGPKYLMGVTCPSCHHTEDVEANLESLVVNEYTPEFEDAKLITLPKSGKLVELKPQTPRDLDLIEYKAKEMQKKAKVNMQYKFLYTLTSNIKKVDGAALDSVALEELIKKLPLSDANFILNKAGELAERVGLDTLIEVTCPECGYELVVPFRITSEFFGPTNY